MSATAVLEQTDTAPRLRAALGRLHRRLRPTAAGVAAGLTPTRVSLLNTIQRLGPVRLSELADEEGINPTMLSRIVSDLVEGGLIERVSDPLDRRAALVTTTRVGKRLVERMRRERRTSSAWRSPVSRRASTERSSEHCPRSKRWRSS